MKLWSFRCNFVCWQFGARTSREGRRRRGWHDRRPCCWTRGPIPILKKSFFWICSSSIKHWTVIFCNLTFCLLFHFFALFKFKFLKLCNWLEKMIEIKEKNDYHLSLSENAIYSTYFLRSQKSKTLSWNLLDVLIIILQIELNCHYF